MANFYINSENDLIYASQIEQISTIVWSVLGGIVAASGSDNVGMA